MSFHPFFVSGVCGGGGFGRTRGAKRSGLCPPGLIVPKKIVSTAVGRNRVKRLLRESFRLQQASLAGLDVVARLKAQVTEDMLRGTFLTGMDQCKFCVERRTRRNLPTNGSE
jgi:RNase P protein component